MKYNGKFPAFLFGKKGEKGEEVVKSKGKGKGKGKPPAKKKK